MGAFNDDVFDLLVDSVMADDCEIRYILIFS